MSCLLRGLNKASANLIHVRADIGSLVLEEGTLSLLILELPRQRSGFSIWRQGRTSTPLPLVGSQGKSHTGVKQPELVRGQSTREQDTWNAVPEHLMADT